MTDRPHHTLVLGQLAEETACQYLQTQGLTVATKNYRCKLGEIDLIMKDNETLVFVEVRMRSNTGYGDGAQTITAAKQRRLRNTANLFLQTQFGNRFPPCRFDVISITTRQGKHQVEWIKDAFH